MHTVGFAQFAAFAFKAVQGARPLPWCLEGSRRCPKVLHGRGGGGMSAEEQISPVMPIREPKYSWSRPSAEPIQPLRVSTQHRTRHLQRLRARDLAIAHHSGERDA